MGEIDDGPGHARRAAKDGEHNEPGEEQHEYVGSPHPWVHEPLGVPVQIGRRHRLHIKIRHKSFLSVNLSVVLLMIQQALVIWEIKFS